MTEQINKKPDEYVQPELQALADIAAACGDFTQSLPSSTRNMVASALRDRIGSIAKALSELSDHRGAVVGALVEKKAE